MLPYFLLMSSLIAACHNQSNDRQVDVGNKGGIIKNPENPEHLDSDPPVRQDPPPGQPIPKGEVPPITAGQKVPVKVKRGIAAFPGAEGHGATALGGRGGEVIYVTNLKDYKKGDDVIKGSLRAAVDHDKPRTVVFKVSGVIALKRPLLIEEDRLTIAGQSAPEPGICLTRYGVIIKAEDIIIRHLRIRPGDSVGRDSKKAFETDAVSIEDKSKYVIIDHVSASWGNDEVISVSGKTVDLITVQNSIISESLHDSTHSKGKHGYAALIRTSGKVSYHHNLFAHHYSRTPRPGTYGDGKLRLDFQSNIIYNSRDGGYSASDPVKMNYIANVHKQTPGFRVGGSSTEIYARNNVTLSSSNTVKSQGDFEKITKTTRKASRAFDLPKIAIKDTEPEQLLGALLPIVGASQPQRDAVDKRVVGDVKAGTGKIIDSHKDVGGYPNMSENKGPQDSDADGLPDDYEQRRGLDPQKSADSRYDGDGDGYSHLEEYLHELSF